MREAASSVLKWCSFCLVTWPMGQVFGSVLVVCVCAGRPGRMLPGRALLPKVFLPSDGPPKLWNCICSPLHHGND